MISSTVREIMGWAFSNSRNLRQVQFNQGSRLLEIGERCFQESGLTSIVLPPSVRVVGNCAFFRCKQLRSV